MNRSEQKALLTANESNIVSDIHKMFERYGPTFVDLAIGKRSDMDALLEFYGAPLRFIGPTFHMVMNDNAAITGPDGMGGEIDRLRKANFAASTLDRCNVSVLNDRAALVDAMVASQRKRSADSTVCGHLPRDSGNGWLAHNVGSEHIGRKVSRQAK